MDTNLETLKQCLWTYLPWITSVVIITLLYLLFKPSRRIQKYMNKLDGPLSLPFIGASYLFVKPNYELIDVLSSLCKKYNPLFKVWIANTAYVALHRAAEIEKILSTTTHIEKSTDYNVLHKWLGLGLLTAKPQLWHNRRKVLTPAFHFKILEEFVDVFNEQGNILVEVLNDKKKEGATIDIFTLITRCALDIICETAMAKKMYAQKGQPLEYVDAVHGYNKMVIRKMLSPWLQIEFIWKLFGYDKLERHYLEVLHNFTERVILARKRERAEKKVNQQPTSFDDKLVTKRRKAFLDLLLDMAENDDSLNDSDIREEVDTFMFEGHDTTAANMGWTIFLLSLYPEHQRRVQEELDEIFGSDRKRDVNSEDISRMKYLALCIKESLRLYPSVPFIIRYLNEDADLGNHRIVPKGANVFLSIVSLHQDPSVFPDPKTFNPERFLPDNCIGRSPYAYIPFSAGPRNCIGQKFALLEEKIVLAKLLMNFNFESVKKREDVKMLIDVILRPMGGILVKITERS